MDIWLLIKKSLCQKYTIVEIIFGNMKKIDGDTTNADKYLFWDDERTGANCKFSDGSAGLFESEYF
jgi:hypothetical protein